MTYYCITGCSTCKDGMVWLDENGLSYEFRNFKKDPLGEVELRKIADRAGVPLRGLLNPKGRNVKNDGLDIENMSDEEVLEAVGRNYKYLYRPMLLLDDGVIFGFNEMKYAPLKEK